MNCFSTTINDWNLVLLNCVTARKIVMEIDLVIVSNDTHNFDCCPAFKSEWFCSLCFSLSLFLIVVHHGC
jgi:hypothetical protein